jgi:hypothetical protein
LMPQSRLCSHLILSLGQSPAVATYIGRWEEKLNQALTPRKAAEGR